MTKSMSQKMTTSNLDCSFLAYPESLCEIWRFARESITPLQSHEYKSNVLLKPDAPLFSLTDSYDFLTNILRER